MSRRPGSGERTRSGNRREEILNASVRAFSASGYGNVSLQEIADEVGITKAAIYYYFPTKQEIVTEALTRAVTTLIGELRTIAENDALRPSEKLSAVLRCHVAALLANRAVYSVYLLDISQVEATARKLIRGEEQWYVSAVSRIIEDGIATGEFRDLQPRVMTHTLLGMCTSTVRWFHPSLGVSAEDVAAAVAETGLSAVRARSTDGAGGDRALASQLLPSSSTGLATRPSGAMSSSSRTRGITSRP